MRFGSAYARRRKFFGRRQVGRLSEMESLNSSPGRLHSRASASSLPLSLVAPGETVTLVGFHDCARLRQRIADLGLNIGLTVRVVKNDFHGPLILAVKNDTRLAIGRGLAYRIQVENNK